MANDDEEGKYAPGNTGPDGSYLVGKNRPPDSGKFRKGDGRKRGRRKRGTRNFASDFNEEMAELVTVTINGKPKRVTRQKSIIMRVADSASRGQLAAVKTVFDIRRKLGDPAVASETSPLRADVDWSKLDIDELEELNRLIGKVTGEDDEP